MTAEILELMRAGDVVVTSQRGIKSLGSLPVRFGNLFKRGYEYRMWTHAAIYVGNGEIVEAQQEGIARKGFLEAYLNKTDFDFVVLRRISLTDEEVEKAVGFCKKQAGREYDKKALAYFLLVNLMPPTLSFILESRTLNRCLNTEAAYFCSELVAKSFLEAKQYCFDRPPYHVMPVDFYNEYGFEKVTERRKNKKINKFKKFLTIIGYTGVMLAWTIALILAAVLIWSLILWIWNLIVKQKAKSLPSQANS